MYIKNIHIENFRNFQNTDIPLKKLTIIVGENDAGKSNLLDAVRLVLNNNGLAYFSRSLSITDINKESYFYGCKDGISKTVVEGLD